MIKSNIMNAKANHTNQQKDVLTSPQGALAGTTISTGKEHYGKLLDRDESDGEKDETGIVMGTEADVTKEEIAILEDASDYTPTTDEENLRQSALDSTDTDGDPLNESKDLSGNDLDVPGSEEDDENEAIGEEDEENNSYSLGGDQHDK